MALRRFKHAFQPIVNSNLLFVWGYEALVRGEHGEPAYDVLSTIKAAELAGFNRQSRQLAMNRFALMAGQGFLSLNSSALCLGTDDNVKKLFELADSISFDRSRLIFEVCETDAIEGAIGLDDAIAEIRASGAQLAMDDFGSGYAGLNALVAMNPDILKLDRYLINEIHRSGPRQSVVKATLQIANDLGMDVIAEGVETLDEYHWLTDVGIELFQGFLFARPEFMTLPKATFPHP